MEERRSTWHGIDTNFVWRGPGGLRLNGGTSSGYSNLNTCYAELDGPDTRGRDGDYRGGCDAVSSWNTRINGTVAYVIPWIDVLTSGVFQGFRGVARYEKEKGPTIEVRSLKLFYNDRNEMARIIEVYLGFALAL